MSFVVDFTSQSMASAGADIVSSKWYFGDGSQGSGNTTSHTYQNAGTYDVRLVVTDSRGETNSVTHSVVLTAPPSYNTASNYIPADSQDDYPSLLRIEDGKYFLNPVLDPIRIYHNYGYPDSEASLFTNDTNAAAHAQGFGDAPFAYSTPTNDRIDGNYSSADPEVAVFKNTTVDSLYYDDRTHFDGTLDTMRTSIIVPYGSNDFRNQRGYNEGMPIIALCAGIDPSDSYSRLEFRFNQWVDTGTSYSKAEVVKVDNVGAETVLATQTLSDAMPPDVVLGEMIIERSGTAWTFIFNNDIYLGGEKFRFESPLSPTESNRYKVGYVGIRWGTQDAGHPIEMPPFGLYEGVVVHDFRDNIIAGYDDTPHWITGFGVGWGLGHGFPSTENRWGLNTATPSLSYDDRTHMDGTQEGARFRLYQIDFDYFSPDNPDAFIGFSLGCDPDDNYSRLEGRFYWTYSAGPLYTAKLVKIDNVGTETVLATSPTVSPAAGFNKATIFEIERRGSEWSARISYAPQPSGGYNYIADGTVLTQATATLGTTDNDRFKVGYSAVTWGYASFTGGHGYLAAANTWAVNTIWPLTQKVQTFLDTFRHSEYSYGQLYVPSYGAGPDVTVKQKYWLGHNSSGTINQNSAFPVNGDQQRWPYIGLGAKYQDYGAGGQTTLGSGQHIDLSSSSAVIDVVDTSVRFPASGTVRLVSGRNAMTFSYTGKTATSITLGTYYDANLDPAFTFDWPADTVVQAVADLENSDTHTNGLFGWWDLTGGFGIYYADDSSWEDFGSGPKSNNTDEVTIEIGDLDGVSATYSGDPVNNGDIIDYSAVNGYNDTYFYFDNVGWGTHPGGPIGFFNGAGGIAPDSFVWLVLKTEGNTITFELWKTDPDVIGNTFLVRMILQLNSAAAITNFGAGVTGAVSVGGEWYPSPTSYIAEWSYE